MVIEDVSRSQTEPQTAETPSKSASQPIETKAESYQLAAPVDRLAALMADTIVLIPLISLATAYFRKIWDLSHVLGETQGSLVSIIMIAVATIATIIVYQVFFLMRFGATPGKLMLGLKVVPLFGTKITYQQAVVRAAIWCVGLFGFLLPWVGAIANVRRRPWHDRIADTEVHSVDPKRAIGRPDAKELAMANVAVSFALCCALGAGIVFLAQAAQYKRQLVRIGAPATDNKFLCSSVDEAQSEWLDTDGKKPSRIETAVGLFSVGAVGAECLEPEAEYVLWNKGEKAVAYLAKALARAEMEDDAKEYLEHVCRGKNANEQLCMLGKLRLKTNIGSESIALDKLLAKPPKFAFTRVLLIDELVEAKRYAEALALVDTSSVPRQLSYFFARSRALALWGLNRKDDARLVFQASLDGLSLPERVQMARWSCEMETLDGCRNQAAYSCKTLMNTVEQQPAELEDEAVAFTWLRANECLARGSLDAQKLKNFSPGKTAQDYVTALTSVAKGKSSEARLKFQEILKTTRKSSPGWYEAYDHFLPLAGTDEVETLAQDWLSIEDEGDLGWIRSGRSLFRRLNASGNYDIALEVGEALVNSNALDESGTRLVIAAMYRAGDIQNASRLFRENLKYAAAGSPGPLSVESRSIASAANSTSSSNSQMGEFDKVAKELAAIRMGPFPEDQAE